MNEWSCKTGDPIFQTWKFPLSFSNNPGSLCSMFHSLLKTGFQVLREYPNWRLHNIYYYYYIGSVIFPTGCCSLNFRKSWFSLQKYNNFDAHVRNSWKVWFMLAKKNSTKFLRHNLFINFLLPQSLSPSHSIYFVFSFALQCKQTEY